MYGTNQLPLQPRILRPEWRHVCVMSGELRCFVQWMYDINQLPLQLRILRPERRPVYGMPGELRCFM